ncbi:MAG: hypothetical protein ACREEV_18385 [Dongiaceae bacterium]
MIGARCARIAVIGLLAAMLPACGSDDSEDIESSPGFSDEDVSVLPSKYGLYAIQDGQLGRVDGERSYQVETWESRSTLQPGVQFLVFDRALDDRSVRLQNAITLRRLAHVRNEVAASGVARPTGKDVWVVAELAEFAVPLDFAPVPGREDMVRAVPSRALEPGLYALEFHQGASTVSGRFGVDWGDVDKNSYIAANCVDRYAGQTARYRRCSDSRPQIGALPQPKSMPQFEPIPPQRSLDSGGLSPSAGQSQSPAVGQTQGTGAAPSKTLGQPTAAPKSATLELRQVQASKAEDQGVPILTVQGVVVNVSNAVQPVPRLVATVKDLQGQELDSWSFAAEVTHLPPGGSTGFRTETVYPTATTQSTNVSVTFVGAGSQS